MFTAQLELHQSHLLIEFLKLLSVELLEEIGAELGCLPDSEFMEINPQSACIDAIMFAISVHD